MVIYIHLFVNVNALIVLNCQLPHKCGLYASFLTQI